jgi:hypothetical protein
MLFDDVKLPWNTILLDQLDPADPEDAEVRAIILRVQAKPKDQSIVTKPTPAPNSPVPPCYGISTLEQAGKPISRPFTEPSDPAASDGRRLRRKYTSQAVKQAAYRERKAALQTL